MNESIWSLDSLINNLPTVTYSLLAHTLKWTCIALSSFTMQLCPFFFPFQFFIIWLSTFYYHFIGDINLINFSPAKILYHLLQTSLGVPTSSLSSSIFQFLSFCLFFSSSSLLSKWILRSFINCDFPYVHSWCQLREVSWREKRPTQCIRHVSRYSWSWTEMPPRLVAFLSLSLQTMHMTLCCPTCTNSPYTTFTIVTSLLFQHPSL